MARPQIAIIGSGIGGLALAIGLLSFPISLTIYEAAPKFDAVGAGIGLGPNALKAISLMSPEFAALYDEIKVGNTNPEKSHEQIEILGAEEGFGRRRGWLGGSVGHADFERSSAHRKALLEIMKSLIPEGTVRFNKKAMEIGQTGNGKKAIVIFADGERIEVDAVIGCDGIKGLSRAAVLEERWPDEVKAKYSQQYVYRGIAPMEDAKRILGTYAEDAKWFMSPGKGWAMYPISGGTEVNIVAFMQDERNWQGEQAAREVSREEMLADFEGFDKRLQNLVEGWVRPMRWPLFHHPDTPTYFNNRICLLGDSAHASGPSQAAGAGQGLEDALILSKLLSLVTHSSELAPAFAAYDVVRRPRAQGVVRDSREVGLMYFLSHGEFGDDLQKITDDANRRLPLIWYHDLEADVRTAETMFRSLVAKVKEGDEDCEGVAHFGRIGIFMSVVAGKDSQDSSIEKVFI